MYLTDGGGIRGYWSLLALKQLMKRIGDEEIRQDKNATHSYYLLEWLPDTTHVDLEDRNTTSKRACSVKDPVRSLGQAQRYLPCHYFDFIGGSSTGGLIAIMLRRLRMTVEDCLEEYERLSDRIFGNPRHFTTLRYLVLNRNKYDTQPVEAVFEDVYNRKGEHRAGEDFAPHEFCLATALSSPGDRRRRQRRLLTLDISYDPKTFTPTINLHLRLEDQQELERLSLKKAKEDVQHAHMTPCVAHEEIIMKAKLINSKSGKLLELLPLRRSTSTRLK